MFYRLFHGDNNGIFRVRTYNFKPPIELLDKLACLHTIPWLDGGVDDFNDMDSFFFTEKALQDSTIRTAILNILTKEHKIKLLVLNKINISWIGKSGLQCTGFIEPETQLMLPFI